MADMAKMQPLDLYVVKRSIEIYVLTLKKLSRFSLNVHENDKIR